MRLIAVGVTVLSSKACRDAAVVHVQVVVPRAADAVDSTTHRKADEMNASVPGPVSTVTGLVISL
jgi:hypothetical protein